jgi:hypothetical protein
VPTTRLRIADDADGCANLTVASRPTSKCCQLTIARSEPCVTWSVGEPGAPVVAIVT